MAGHENPDVVQACGSVTLTGSVLRLVDATSVEGHQA